MNWSLSEIQAWAARGSGLSSVEGSISFQVRKAITQVSNRSMKQELFYTGRTFLEIDHPHFRVIQDFLVVPTSKHQKRFIDSDHGMIMANLRDLTRDCAFGPLASICDGGYDLYVAIAREDQHILRFKKYKLSSSALGESPPQTIRRGPTMTLLCHTRGVGFSPEH